MQIPYGNFFVDIRDAVVRELLSKKYVNRFKVVTDGSSG